jgi:hypothetical protein
MSITPQSGPVALRYDGRVFVPEHPLPHLAPGTVVHVWTGHESEQKEEEGRDAPAPEKLGARLSGLAGAWADFDFVEPEELPYDKEESLG